jgi:hypothetical protein
VGASVRRELQLVCPQKWQFLRGSRVSVTAISYKIFWNLNCTFSSFLWSLLLCAVLLFHYALCFAFGIVTSILLLPPPPPRVMFIFYAGQKPILPSLLSSSDNSFHPCWWIEMSHDLSFLCRLVIKNALCLLNMDSDDDLVKSVKAHSYFIMLPVGSG